MPEQDLAQAFLANFIAAANLKGKMTGTKKNIQVVRVRKE